MGYNIVCKHCGFLEFYHDSKDLSYKLSSRKEKKKINACPGYAPKNPREELKLYLVSKDRKNIHKNSRLEKVLEEMPKEKKDKLKKEIKSRLERGSV